MTLEQLYKDNRKKFIQKLLPYTKNYAVAEDLVQEAFIKAINRQHQFDPKRGSLKGWFVKVLFSGLWDYMRVEKRKPFTFNLDTLLETDLFSYEEVPELEDKIEDIKNPRHRKIIYLYMVLGYSYLETAEQCVTTQVNIRKIVQRFRGIQNDTST